MGDLESNPQPQLSDDLTEWLEEDDVVANTGRAEGTPEALSEQLSLIEAEARADDAGDRLFEKMEARGNSTSDSDDLAALQDLLRGVSSAASTSLNLATDRKTGSALDLDFDGNSQFEPKKGPKRPYLGDGDSADSSAVHVKPDESPPLVLFSTGTGE